MAPCMQPLLGVLGSVCEATAQVADAEVERQTQAAPEYEKWIAQALAEADSVDGPFWLPCVRDQRDPLKSCSASANLSWIMQHFLSQLCQESQQKEASTPKSQPRSTGPRCPSGTMSSAAKAPAAEQESSSRDVAEPSSPIGSPIVASPPKRPRTRPDCKDFASPLSERIAKAPSPIRALHLGPRPGMPCPVDDEAGGPSEVPVPELAPGSPAKPMLPRAAPAPSPAPAERPLATVVAAPRSGPAAPAALAQDSTIEPTEEIHLPSRPAISMAEWKSKALFAAAPPESPKEVKVRSRIRPPASGQQALRCKERQQGETQVEKTSPERKDQSTPIKVADRIMMFEMLKTWTPQTAEKVISPSVQCSKAGAASSAPRMMKPPSANRGSASTDRGSACSAAVDGSSLFTPVQHPWARDVKPKELFRHSDLAPTRPPLAKSVRKPTGPTTAFGSTVPPIPAKHVVATALQPPSSARSAEAEPPDSARSAEAFGRLALGHKRDDIAKPKSLRAAEQAKQAEERRQKERQEREQERDRARIAAAQAAAAQVAQEARAKAAVAAPGPRDTPKTAAPKNARPSNEPLLSPGFLARHASAPVLPLQERPVQVETVEDHQLKRMPSVPLFREPYLDLRNINLSPKKPEDNYAISDYGGDSEGEDTAAREKMRQKKAVPRWCDRYLLQVQKQVDIDPDTIFGKVPRCVLDDMFPDFLYQQARQKRPARRRGSSGDWRRDRLTRCEIRSYKQRMGQKRSWDDGHVVDGRH